MRKQLVELHCQQAAAATDGCVTNAFATTIAAATAADGHKFKDSR
jgi:hypothetical protein